MLFCRSILLIVLPELRGPLQVDVIMGSDHLGTSLAAGDAGFEEPEFAFWHEYNSGAGPPPPTSQSNCFGGLCKP